MVLRPQPPLHLWSSFYYRTPRNLYNNVAAVHPITARLLAQATATLVLLAFGLLLGLDR
jgi:hypothetical protein